jgi:hypothetical protein
MDVYTIIQSLLILSFALLLSFVFTTYEAFVDTSGAQECGVDRPPCLGNNKCMNGWCVRNTPPSLSVSTGLPVYP